MDQFFDYEHHEKKYRLPLVHREYHLKNGLFEKDLLEFCYNLCNERNMKNKVFIDIGAHCGTYSVYLKELFVTIWAFEPNSIICQYGLMPTLEYNNHKYNYIWPFRYALGSEEQCGNQKLYIDSVDGGTGSLYEKKDYIGVMDVSVITLDGFMDCKNKNHFDIGFIKIDVEGNELNVLKGGILTIQKYRPYILFECNGSITDLKNYLNGTNYNVYKTIQNNMFLGVPKEKITDINLDLV